MCDKRFLRSIDEVESVTRMLATRVNTNLVDSAGAPTTMTIAQRTQALTAISYQLVGIARGSESGTRWVMKELKEIVQKYGKKQPASQIPYAQIAQMEPTQVVANPVIPDGRKSGKRHLDGHDIAQKAAKKAKAKEDKKAKSAATNLAPSKTSAYRL